MSVKKTTKTTKTTKISNGVPMTPREIVGELDSWIIGQGDAKRAVAIALRNRWRRRQLEGTLRQEVTPKNILMIGPTGVGKTEIARRLANLAHAPFIKVEATKFTEVGYVGRDVDSIVRDLIEVSLKMTREREKQKVEKRAEDAAVEKILDILLPPVRGAVKGGIGFANEPESSVESLTKTDPKAELSTARKTFKEQLYAGDLDDKEIEIDVKSSPANMEIMGPPGMEDMTQQLQGLFENISSGKTKKRKLRIQDAFKVLKDQEASRMVNEDDIKRNSIENAEQNGIIFLDEIDKIVRRSDSQMSGEVSKEGVQRDLLPLVEGCSISTKYGMVKTDHMLFISSGAFHVSKPSDLIPELQGRLPIRVELKALVVNDFVRILTEPDASLVEQYTALMATEGVIIEFTPTAIKRIAQIAWQVNKRLENIGARRLHTLMERLLESLSFEASDRSGDKVKIDKKYVDNALTDLAENEDLSRYIL